MGRPGLVGTMARTAVIAGTATAVSGSVASRQQAGAAQAQAAAQQQADQAAQSQADLTAMQAQLAALQQHQADAPPTPAPESSAGDLMAQLERLGNLKSAGVLNDEEFSAAKARLLGL